MKAGRFLRDFFICQKVNHHINIDNDDYVDYIDVHPDDDGVKAVKIQRKIPTLLDLREVHNKVTN